MYRIIPFAIVFSLLTTPACNNPGRKPGTAGNTNTARSVAGAVAAAGEEEDANEAIAMVAASQHARDLQRRLSEQLGNTTQLSYKIFCEPNTEEPYYGVEAGYKKQGSFVKVANYAVDVFHRKLLSVDTNNHSLTEVK